MQYNPKEDGKTHLNLYSKANTELGRFCSNFAYCPIETEDGHFDSIEGYWGWLSISENNPKRESFRTLSGFAAKKLKDDLYKEGDPGRFDTDFQRKIKNAVHLKFQTKEANDLMYKFRDLISLPICHYYSYDNGPTLKIVDVTEEYPEFVNSIKDEFDNFLEKNGAMFGVCKGIVCQQVNCQAVMGAGLAKAIVEKYPKVYDSYMNTFKKNSKESLFGKVDIVPIGEDFYVANIYSQFNYGNPSKTGLVYTDANKLVRAVNEICKKYPNLPVYLPHTRNLEGKEEYGIGCGYGGESWEKLSSMFRNLGWENLHLLDTKTGKVHELEVSDELPHIQSKYPFCKGMSKIGYEMEQYQADMASKYKYEPLKGDVKKDALETYLKTLPPCFMGKLRELPTGYEVQGKQQPLFLKDGTKIANGYTRIVVGHYGAFLEIEDKDVVKDKMVTKKGEEYRSTAKYAGNVKYFWLTVGDTEAKIYEQQKGVTYADYKPGRYYISPYEIMDKEEVQKISEKWNSEFLPFENNNVNQIDLHIDPTLYEGKAIVFDLETTGLFAANGDEPLQIAIVNEEEKVVLQTYLKPYFKKYWYDAEKVNHISPSMVKNAPHMDELSDILQDIFSKASVVVGHNATFDITFTEKYGNVTIPRDKVFDTCKYFKKDEPSISHKLENAVTYYCPEYKSDYQKGAHDALVDTVATVRVYNAIQEKEKEKER